MRPPSRPSRILATGLALAGLLTGLLTGCSAEEEPSPRAAGSAPEASAPSAGMPAPAAGPTDAASPPAPTWYVSLGDSLAAGYQPGTGDDPTTGYAGRLAAGLRADGPGLRLQALGCSGETARSLLDGGVCSYASGSQLAQAEAFLRQHRGQVRLVTIDIGANDVLGCAGGGRADRVACVTRALPRVRADVAEALRRIRSAAPDVRVAGMTYYDPLLASWLFGPQLRPLARQSAALMARTNTVLESAYRAAGAEVAEVAEAFDTGRADLVDSPQGRVPRDVATVCRLTWMCTQADIHANDAGYAVIADAFASALAGEAVHSSASPGTDG